MRERERCCTARESEGMIELSTLQTVTMRGIHLFWCQAANLEAVRAFPAPTLALAGWEPQTHPSTHVPRHISGAPATHTNHPINTSNASPELEALGRDVSWVNAVYMHVFVFFFCVLSFVRVSFIICLIPVTVFLFGFFCSSISAKMRLSSLLTLSPAASCYQSVKTNTHCV